MEGNAGVEEALGQLRVKQGFGRIWRAAVIRAL
jgi:hypothetical protein